MTAERPNICVTAIYKPNNSYPTQPRRINKKTGTAPFHDLYSGKINIIELSDYVAHYLPSLSKTVAN